MIDQNQILTSDSIQMLVSSMTNQGHARLQEIEVERFLNALARAQSNVPTGVPATAAPKES